MSAARDWRAERRARTRHLIELGGLVLKSGLVELVADDRATLLGLLLDDADRLRGLDEAGGRPDEVKARARHRGLKAFDADAEARAGGSPAGGGHPVTGR
ncbi:conjugal transfer protein TraD [Roseomonas mucosa]|uniref:conjugal transfer protein TraD n=1 Tax=Roseomonas mucosa TaxID=207340 RepID=UPI0028CF8000|nr:conjugal transfer protein TraD [Roseomonas mucosa]MDT8278497.1 conjugal transfer protein TraD [Roseomonas mucosa]